MLPPIPSRRPRAVALLRRRSLLAPESAPGWLLLLVGLLLLLAPSRAEAAPWDEEPRPTAAMEGEAASRQQRIEAAYLFALAKLHSEEGDHQDAARAFARAAELDSGDAYFHLERARFESYLVQVVREPRQRRQHLERAAAAAERARELAPENVDVLAVYARLLLQIGEQDPTALDRAQAAYEELRTRTVGDLQVLTSLGQLYLWRKEHGKAAEVLDEAARYRPGNRIIQSMLVEARLGAGELPAAEAALVELVAIEPTSVEHRLRLAQLLGQRGAHDRAVAVLREAPEEVQGNLRLRHHLARELFLLGEAEASLEQVDFLLQDLPDDDKLRRLRLAVLPAAGRFEEAIAELEGLRAAGGAEAETALQDAILLSRLRERAGRGDEAAAGLRQEIAQRQGRQDLQGGKDLEAEALQLVATLAGVLERAGDGAAAVALLEEAFAGAAAPQALGLGEELVEVLHRQGDDARALEVVGELRARLASLEQPTAARERLDLLELALLAETERWEEVLAKAPQLFAAAASGEGDESTAMTARFLHADALVGVGRVDEAVAGLAAIAGDGNAEVVAAKQADLLFAADRDADARAVLAPWQESESNEDRIYLARVLQRSERYTESLPLLQAASAAEPERTDLLFMLGTAYERSGAAAAAVESFRRLLEIQPSHAPAMNYLGYMWAERREALPEALQLIRRAVALDPDNGAYLDSLGWAYFQLGRYAEARGPLEWAARLVPEDPTVFEHLGDLYVELDEVELARSSYRTALGLDSENADEVERKLENLGEPAAGGGGR